MAQQPCRQQASPMTMLAVPLLIKQDVIGSVVLGREPEEAYPISYDEMRLILSTARQLGLAIENARLYEEAQARERYLGEMLHQIVTAQESERQRIARELHDATGQSLTAIALGLRGVESVIASNPTLAQSQLQAIKTYTTDALAELRRIITDLRPSQLDDLGLVAALQWYTQEFEKHYGIATDLQVKGERTRLQAEYETVLFRIVQEALTNVAKHANARQATVTLTIAPTQATVIIRDDGRGFDPEAVLASQNPNVGWGLRGIQERATLLGGTYSIRSRRGEGTVVQVSVPLTREDQHEENTTAAGG